MTATILVLQERWLVCWPCVIIMSQALLYTLKKMRDQNWTLQRHSLKMFSGWQVHFNSEKICNHLLSLGRLHPSIDSGCSSNPFFIQICDYLHELQRHINGFALWRAESNDACRDEVSLQLQAVLICQGDWAIFKHLDMYQSNVWITFKARPWLVSWMPVI